MAYRTFLVLLLVVADCLSFNESRRVIFDHYDGDDHHLGYFIKTVKQENDHERTRQNAVGIQEKITFGTDKAIVTSLDLRQEHLEDFSAERVKNDSALPLHVTSTARQECLEGYQADENGTCQKVLAPKGEKTFKLRRKRDQQQPKMSYADVLKYGRTPPFKAEIITTTLKTPDVRANTVTAAVKPVPTKAAGVTTPTAVPVKKDEPAVKPIVNEVMTTASATSANKADVTTAPPLVKLADIGVTTPALVNKVEATTVPSSIKPVVTSAATAMSVKTESNPGPPTARPIAAAPTKSSGLVIPTIISKIPTRVKSFFGDINRAFLSGEKQSIAAQAAEPNPTGKFPASTRLRRWSRML